MLKNLWNDEIGALLSAEFILLATILVIGAVVGLRAVQEAIVTELADVAQAVAQVNQSYSIERKDTGEDWNEYLTRLMREEGLLDDRDDDDPPNHNELRKFDKARKTSVFPTTSGRARPIPTVASRR
jgi:hypothetical protein